MSNPANGAGLAPPPPDIYVEVMTLARRLGAVNLAQGFPEDDTADLVAAMAPAVRTGDTQYEALSGLPLLRTELALRAERCGLRYDPEDEVTVTLGCTEAVAAALLAVVPPGSEIVTMEPFYDNYPGLAKMVGATLVPVPLAGLDGAGSLGLDVAALRAAITPRTRVILLNTPNNPAGHMITAAEADEIARLAVAHDLVVVTDEVYEEHTYDRPHIRLAGYPGMRERTIVCSSASKLLSVGGWRIGWVYAPRELTALVQHHHRHLTFTAPTPLQAGVAAGLRWADETGYHDRLRAEYRRRRDILVSGLTSLGLTPRIPPGGFFVTADVAPWTAGASIEDLARSLVSDTGVAALPMGDFFRDPGAAGSTLRFAFCKPAPVLEEAVRRLGARFGSARPAPRTT
ncbi:aminotransferase class I/II-fold pyridoxal phosphate-dependent enzyme [Kitasatospora sp. NBC_00240]|uniref:aminotransferase class I/II-fold pyridoxal phosphate-dependent enzyme n=1 Tax=Kitasatospora sp. NBC_00240 TaxID=2903567 RepID=UPI00225045CF|nr:aminotransferase class I/II-fold pyridoxal phosphate-dependent enzyme [Kitasatospora sp. NBC_00240]MCX5214520.1 aminotransferase class I/II-fold pyridoxal phosphate-dependent enzyme [Kitasatospora sp. NBC_00240]